MIEVITGKPGDGKTLYTISKVKERAEKETRPVFYSGIDGLQLDWTEINPEEWYLCPANSIIIIDECQRIFRPRSHGKEVPRYVMELETHRHLGVDLYFITQHPMLIDSNVRRLCGLHFHVSRKFGMKRATILEFQSIQEQPLKKLDDAVRHEWKYPVEAFSYYKSAEVHTHKVRIPTRVWLLLALPVVIVAMIWFFYSRHFEDGKMKNPIEGANPAASPAKPGLSPSGPPGQRSPELIQASFRPRIDGLEFTAPLYEKLIEAKRAPFPTGGYIIRGECHVFSGQYELKLPRAMCVAMVNDGVFPFWQDKDQGRSELAQASRPAQTAAPQAANTPPVLVH